MPTQDINIDETKTNLMADIKYLTEVVGERSYMDVEKLNMTADYIEERFRSIGCDTKRQPFQYAGNTYWNIICEIRGLSEPDKTIVIGAHYDTVSGTPGADDNASGVAGIIELARLSLKNPLPMTIHLVSFSIEEPPLFRTRQMGSYAYAESLRKERANIIGMVSLEMIGYFSESKGTQFYPLPFFRWFYPEKGDFIAFVGNLKSRAFTRKFKSAFTNVSRIPVESLNAVSLVPGVDFSDHSSFWKFGFPAFMITDTAFYRNPNYHGRGDTASTLDYERMSEIIRGIYMALKLI
ncbi:MAG: M28 family peptidase [Nitrospirae bacterium]|nr:M28 family peptidase [Nitrospirota bacterium]